MTHTRKELAKLWAKWKAIDPTLTTFWFDEDRHVWMGGEVMHSSDGKHDVHNEFEMGDVIPQAAEYIREHIAKESEGKRS